MGFIIFEILAENQKKSPLVPTGSLSSRPTRGGFLFLSWRRTEGVKPGFKTPGFFTRFV